MDAPAAASHQPLRLAGAVRRLESLAAVSRREKLATIPRAGLALLHRERIGWPERGHGVPAVPSRRSGDIAALTLPA